MPEASIVRAAMSLNLDHARQRRVIAAVYESCYATHVWFLVSVAVLNHQHQNGRSSGYAKHTGVLGFKSIIKIMLDIFTT
ncbi:MAG: hypothetical protein WBP69_17790 [Terriglobales bacterium]